MSYSFDELVQLASSNDPTFGEVSRDVCLAAAKAYSAAKRGEIRQLHDANESGWNVVHMLAVASDTLLRGVLAFGLYQVKNQKLVRSRIALCALGGYGRQELSPGSDLDVCLLYDGQLDANIEALNSYIIPFIWDLGFTVGYQLLSVAEAMNLARQENQAYTTFLQGRLIGGDNTVFARLKLFVRDMDWGGTQGLFVREKIDERKELPSEYTDLYTPEPNVKENAGGMRDLHTAQWIYMSLYGCYTLDDVYGRGITSDEEHLELVNAVDFVLRIRNELHFYTGKSEDRLTFANQKHVAQVFGYGPGDQLAVTRLMQDYYAAAHRIRQFFLIAAKTCEPDTRASVPEPHRHLRPGFTVSDGQLFAGAGDEHWFAENPVRLMDVFWECARRGVTLSRATERLVAANLYLVGDTFRRNEIVRRFFIAICNRPKFAGHALRQAAETGLLGAYLPEFRDVQGLICYEDFHHYPVDEHTLRALEALGELDAMDGPVGRCLHTAMEHATDAYILVLAILMHDLGKVEGEAHSQKGVELTHQICERMGLRREDEERIAFLVKHHLLMTRLSQYRDIDDEEIVRSFAQTMQNQERLRALFLLSYADMAAVGPDVWNEWKGTLLLKLYLRAEMILQGRGHFIDEEFWVSQKARETAAHVSPELRPRVEQHLRDMGDRYFAAFAPKYQAVHLETLAKAEESGLEMLCTEEPETGMSEVVVCTRDRVGLFAIITGSFASQLVDVNGAALFTHPNGYVVDCFTVADARRRSPLSNRQFKSVKRALKAALFEGVDIHEQVEQSRRRLFALLQPPIPVPTRISFDNESSRTHTVIDIETGDRTGLLYDLTRAMAELDLDISTARIVTDARRIHDSFYVTMNALKIEEDTVQASIREELHKAIHPARLTTEKEAVNETP